MHPSNILYTTDDQSRTVQLPDVKGLKALHRAVKSGNLKHAKYLPGHRTAINQADKKGLTQLHTASQTDRLPEVKYLLRQGANIDQRDNDGEDSFASCIGKRF